MDERCQHIWQSKYPDQLFRCRLCGTAKPISEISNRDLLEYIFRWVVKREQV